MRKAEIFWLLLWLGLAAAGWIVWGIFYDYWTQPRISTQDQKGWLIACIALYVAIAATVLFVIYSFILGARNYQRQRKGKMEQERLQQLAMRFPPATNAVPTFKPSPVS